MNTSLTTISRRTLLAGSAAAGAVSLSGLPAFATAVSGKTRKPISAYDNSALQRHLCSQVHPKMANNLMMDVVAARAKGDVEAEIAALRGCQCAHCNTHISTSLEFMAVAA